MAAAPLYESTLVTVHRVVHSSRPLVGSAAEDCAAGYSLNFVERGTFSLRMRHRRWTVSGRDVFVTEPGMAYRCGEIDRPNEAPPGVCLDVRYTSEARDSIGRLVDGLRAHVPIVCMTNRRDYLRRRLAAHLPGTDSQIAIDLLAGELLHSVFDVGGGKRQLHRPAQLAWYARRIDRAREALDHDFASRHTLAGLAREAGMSPYHFARVFRELTGMPPHRYLLRRRLAAAVEQLRDGASVTTTCYAVGFGSLSHFVHAFKAAFQASPSQVRCTAAPRNRPSLRGWREANRPGILEK